jgi:hypothetical protein
MRKVQRMRPGDTRGHEYALVRKAVIWAGTGDRRHPYRRRLTMPDERRTFDDGVAPSPRHAASSHLQFSRRFAMFFLSIEFQETGYVLTAASAPDASLQLGGVPMPPFPGTPEFTDPSWPVG